MAHGPVRLAAIAVVAAALLATGCDRAMELTLGFDRTGNFRNMDRDYLELGGSIACTRPAAVDLRPTLTQGSLTEAADAWLRVSCPGPSGTRWRGTFRFNTSGFDFGEAQASVRACTVATTRPLDEDCVTAVRDVGFVLEYGL